MQLQYAGKKKIISADHTTDDIIAEVINAHKVFAKDYDTIAGSFWKGSQLATLEYIFNYCKKKFPYRVEGEARQTTRSPGAIVETSKKIGVDCKHYAGWIAGILDALNRSGKSFSWCYRFASYDVFNSTAEHVFIVATIGGVQYWIDPVLPYFNERNPAPVYYFDKKIKAMIGTTILNRSTGLNATLARPTVTDVVISPTPVNKELQTEILKNIVNRNEATATETPTEKNNLLLLLAGGVLLWYMLRK